ncbi:hypothetical protein [Altericista sp. CCNU0014]|uniref:hypothetical protein n=1 Tax=Altericista sp. CCNU0014 TaxID=3082949 RepID=UPI00384B129B
MGKDSHIQFLPSKPVISLEYANLSLRKSLGQDIILNCLAFKEPSSRLPSLQKPNSHNSYSNFSISMDTFERFNPDYWREYEAYIRSLALVRQIGFVLYNQSNFLAQNVRIEIHVNAEKNITVFDLDSVPDRPAKTEMEKISRGIKSVHAKKIQTIVKSYGSQWIISANIGNIQPQQKAWIEEPFFIGCTSPNSLEMEVLIYADNLPEPKKERLVIQFEVQDEPALNINKLEFFQTSHNFIEDNLNFHRNRTLLP